MSDVEPCPRCSGHAVFHLEPSGKTHNSGYYICQGCKLKLSEIISTVAVPVPTIQEFAAVGWNSRSRRWKVEGGE